MEYKTVIDFLTGHYITCNGVVVCSITDEELVYFIEASRKVIAHKRLNAEQKEKWLTIYIQNLIINTKAA